MNTKRLFDEDAYLPQFESCVLSCEEDGELYKVELMETAFFPEEGGQSCDRGTLQEIPVIRVREEDGVIYHWLSEPLWEGDTVTGLIDWKKRFWDMQQHTGEHIVSGLIHERYGLDNVGFHLGEAYVRMDFNGVLDAAQLARIENLANEAVAKDLPVEILWPDREALAELDYRSKKPIDGQVRLVRIPGVDLCACCAPHVRRTGEIGLIKITGFEKYKGGVRVYMLCGFRALADYREKEQSVREISALLSAKPDQVSGAAARLKEENQNLRFELAAVRQILLEEHAAGIPARAAGCCFFDPYMDQTNIRRIWNRITAEREGLCGCFAGSDETGYMLILGGAGADARAAGRALTAALGGKGGGSAEMFQGSTPAKRAQIEAWFDRAL